MSKRGVNLVVLGGSLVLTALWDSSARTDVVAQHNVAFNAKKINPYTGGPAIDVGGVHSIIPNDFFNGKVRADLPFINVDPLSVALESLLGVSLPSLVKRQVGGTLAGNANLSFGYYATAGRVDISYPASANLTLQTIEGGDYVIGDNVYTSGSEFLPGVSQRVVPPEFLVNSGGVGYATSPLGGVSFNEYGAPSFATTSPGASAVVPKHNLGIEFGLGDLQLVTASFSRFDPNWNVIYELTFNRAVVGQSESRVYRATVTGSYRNLTPSKLRAKVCSRLIRMAR